MGLVVVPTAAAAAAPATLTGEAFSESAVIETICQQGGSVSYSASGTATGPYPGTFTETGSASGTGPSGNPPTSVTSYSASFTIYSPSGAVLVKGTKTGGSASSAIFCQDTSGSTFFQIVNAPYQATIFTASGNYSDQGTSQGQVATNSSSTFLDEDFESALTQPVLISPTSKDQCKNGGWRNFGSTFTNQGDCVSFVENGK